MRTISETAEVVIYSMRTVSNKFSPMFSFDVGKFRDPMGNTRLTSLYHDGQPVAVRDWIKEDPRMNGILEAVTMIATDRIKNSGRKFLSFAFRDYHARWISRAIAEVVADKLGDEGFSVGVVHESLS